MFTTQLKVDRETFSAASTVLDTSVEQSVEKDFVLPDYYADIFRILKCIVNARVLSQTINGGKLSFEMCVTARVLYCSENDSKVNCIVQNMNYTKSVDIGDNCSNPSISITPHCDYVNCRVISPRRLDIRGAVTSRIKVSCEKKQSIVTDAQGCNIQLRKQLLTYPSKRLTADKRITLIEELELASDKPPVDQVVRTDCFIEPSEQKIIAGKLVTKGNAQISMCYSCINTSGEETLENMRFSIPFSQIIDIDGIDESFEASVEITPSGCEIMPSAGSQSSLECELVMFVNCVAVKYETAEVVTDAYSTCYECEIKSSEGSMESVPINVMQTVVSKAKALYPDESIRCVYDSWANVENTNVSYDPDKKVFIVSGNTKFSVLAKSESDQPVFLVAEEPFEQEISAPEQLSQLNDRKCEPYVSVKNCEYTMPDDNSIELTAELVIRASMSASAAKQIVSDISVLTDKPKEKNGDCAIKLCYCSEQEDIWEIAKRYSTLISAILEENELNDENAARSGMLLIPLIN